MTLVFLVLWHYIAFSRGHRSKFIRLDGGIDCSVPMKLVGFTMCPQNWGEFAIFIAFVLHLKKQLLYIDRF